MIDLVHTQNIKEQLSENPEGVQAIIDSAKVGICITNSETNFVAVNNMYCEIYGYSREELIGKAFTLVVPEINRPRMDFLHQKFLRDKREIARKWEVENKEGKRLEISVDTAYSERLFDKTPHKITFVQVE